MDIQYQWRNKSDAGLLKIIAYFLESSIGLETLRAVVNFVMRGRKFLEARTQLSSQFSESLCASLVVVTSFARTFQEIVTLLYRVHARITHEAPSMILSSRTISIKNKLDTLVIRVGQAITLPYYPFRNLVPLTNDRGFS